MEPNYYPNCDINIWLRTAKDEIKKPVEGKVSYGKLNKIYKFYKQSSSMEEIRNNYKSLF